MHTQNLYTIIKSCTLHAPPSSKLTYTVYTATLHGRIITQYIYIFLSLQSLKVNMKWSVFVAVIYLLYKY